MHVNVECVFNKLYGTLVMWLIIFMPLIVLCLFTWLIFLTVLSMCIVTEASFYCVGSNLEVCDIAIKKGPNWCIEPAVCQNGSPHDWRIFIIFAIMLLNFEYFYMSVCILLTNLHKIWRDHLKVAISFKNEGIWTPVSEHQSFALVKSVYKQQLGLFGHKICILDCKGEWTFQSSNK